ncbi:hypothetical protein HNR23_002014 [Nocardiopsis mwathae]|uniref:DUF397 domain-containing protein n=1 Tax=Nocardiopsis mwathae TaxID=1472723 RepID=A0A7W9YGX6_9ACTN|nr:DUF397 domain-containing protein [Nocardiopsis mwathae]MBB6171954.1 hypothetical protein [Nocardiopsis mwathae]
MTELRWHTSSYSGGSTGTCVEVAEGLMTAVRDTQHRHHGHLEFPSTEWTKFLTSVKDRQL